MILPLILQAVPADTEWSTDELSVPGFGKIKDLRENKYYIYKPLNYEVVCYAAIANLNIHQEGCKLARYAHLLYRWGNMQKAT